MKNILFKLLIFLIPIIGGYIGYLLYHDYHATAWYSIYTFICGSILGYIIALVGIWARNITINSYKRELEKESISSEENAAKVKVLESKIEVLEKALENALKK